MKNILVMLLLFVSASPRAATVTAISTSLTDVSNAVYSASPGDSVIIPAGSSTWSTYLYVTNPIFIFGSGTNSTHITRTNGPCVWFRLTTNQPIRLSAIKFTGGWNDEIVYIDGKRESDSTSRAPITAFRVDNCEFNQGKRAVWPIGWAYGVIDHNTFINCNIAVSPQGDNTAAWNRAEGYGTTNAVVVESNTFIVNDSAPAEPNEQLYHFEGARSATRFNTFDFTAATSYNGLPFESHGNYSTAGVTDPYTTNCLATRGQPVIEIYNNTMAVHHTYRFIYLRGGSVIIASNALTYASGSVPSAIQLTDEETWQTSWFSPLRTNRYANDGITNSFFWANTLNGAPITTASVSGSDTNVIAQNMEYWMQAPNATNGSPAGVLQSYTPLAYPHPLVTAQDGGGGTLIFSAPATARSATVGRIQ